VADEDVRAPSSGGREIKVMAPKNAFLPPNPRLNLGGFEPDQKALSLSPDPCIVSAASVAPLS